MSFIQTEIETEQLKNKIAPEKLDVVLMLQFFVSWAGEGLTDPPRLDWWSTELLYEWGGEDLFKRLFPKTCEWALLEAVRKVAIQADRQKRLNLAQPDNVCTLFFWGFGIDEKLEERLSFYKQNGSKPQDILGFPLDITKEFEKKAFEESIRAFDLKIKSQVVPEGREIKDVMPGSIADVAKNLVSGLIPLADKYPMPFYRIEPTGTFKKARAV